MTSLWSVVLLSTFSSCQSGVATANNSPEMFGTVPTPDALPDAREPVNANLLKYLYFASPLHVQPVHTVQF